MERTDVTRERRRLWRVTFLIIGALVAGVVFLAAGGTTVALPDFMPSQRVLALGLVGIALTFMAYAIDAERKLTRLALGLLAERSERLTLAEEGAEQRDFISITAHELRTPLTVIKGFVATLAAREGVIDADRRGRYLQIVNDQTDRLARLVDDLMEVSRIDAGRLSLAEEPVEMPSLIAGLVDAHESWHARVRVTSTTVPPITADLRRIEAIVVNLVENALKYSDSDVDISVRRTADGDVALAVRDAGRGIAPDAIGGLFQKFHRLPEAEEGDVPGTGLGLYIVRALVEAHGGTVGVVSTVGRGSTFTVTLPAARTLQITA